ncbi:hypothetical protein H632_c4196p0, partial [Helicosporidium sp. ATCC 50920]
AGGLAPRPPVRERRRRSARLFAAGRFRRRRGAGSGGGGGRAGRRAPGAGLWRALRAKRAGVAFRAHSSSCPRLAVPARAGGRSAARLWRRSRGQAHHGAARRRVRGRRRGQRALPRFRVDRSLRGLPRGGGEGKPGPARPARLWLSPPRRRRRAPPLAGPRASRPGDPLRRPRGGLGKGSKGRGSEHPARGRGRERRLGGGAGSFGGHLRGGGVLPLEASHRLQAGVRLVPGPRPRAAQGVGRGEAQSRARAARLGRRRLPRPPSRLGRALRRLGPPGAPGAHRVAGGAGAPGPGLAHAVRPARRAAA